MSESKTLPNEKESIENRYFLSSGTADYVRQDVNSQNAYRASFNDHAYDADHSLDELVSNEIEKLSVNDILNCLVGFSLISNMSRGQSFVERVRDGFGLHNLEKSYSLLFEYVDKIPGLKNDDANKVKYKQDLVLLFNARIKDRLVYDISGGFNNYDSIDVAFIRKKFTSYFNEFGEKNRYLMVNNGIMPVNDDITRNRIFGSTRQNFKPSFEFSDMLLGLNYKHDAKKNKCAFTINARADIILQYQDPSSEEKNIRDSAKFYNSVKKKKDIKQVILQDQDGYLRNGYTVEDRSYFLARQLSAYLLSNDIKDLKHNNVKFNNTREIIEKFYNDNKIGEKYTTDIDTFKQDMVRTISNLVDRMHKFYFGNDIDIPNPTNESSLDFAKKCSYIIDFLSLKVSSVPGIDPITTKIVNNINLIKNLAPNDINRSINLFHSFTVQGKNKALDVKGNFEDYKRLIEEEKKNAELKKFQIQEEKQKKEAEEKRKREERKKMQKNEKTQPSQKTIHFINETDLSSHHSNSHKTDIQNQQPKTRLSRRTSRKNDQNNPHNQSSFNPPIFDNSQSSSNSHKKPRSQVLQTTNQNKIPENFRENPNSPIVPEHVAHVFDEQYKRVVFKNGEQGHQAFYAKKNNNNQSPTSNVRDSQSAQKKRDFKIGNHVNQVNSQKLSEKQESKNQAIRGQLPKINNN
ncbi:MAG: hypothetical protein Ta2D_04270 [Rickettsiales bacterium]|nr:MAG: hypothetical protein Ta2D_04270 [Rickettsiales bacterium]